MRLILISLLSALAVNARSTKPNIVFFLSDDHRWDSIGCAGHSILKTPELDKLAREWCTLRKHVCNNLYLCRQPRSQF